ncbi:uncharacterized protein LOC113750386 [Coffea eugenioides]|uniref:uncharacterized protein LOC113750386 n=1 Tax=Coffea eugenioides TaxID=49369 RepID=UPI000F60B884|nr:uncharacterized protein LOC113750386 [Coffea eugenioides]
MHNSSGDYTTKSGYAQARLKLSKKANKMQANERSSARNDDPTLWHQVWDLNIKHKLKHFLWKCLHNILPTNEEVHRRTCKGDKWCKCCGEEVETLEHLFFNCKAREEAWKTFPIKWDGIQESSWNFWKWWEALQSARCRVNGISHIEATTNFLWQLWKARNVCNFNKESTKGNLISSRALEEWLEYKQMWDLEKRESKKDDPEVPTMTITEELQDQHVILMFTDATMDKKRSRGGLGIATKDHNGKLVKTWAIPTGMMKDAAILEAEAIRSAMLKALEEGWTSLLIHSDCKCLVDRFNHRCIGLSLLDVLVDDIVHLSRSF